ncbi:hypothetical protein ACFE04_031511 [Oxalis oulophora]
MEITEAGVPAKFGARETSDVVVRIRTEDGRDEWMYCHSDVLIANCKYFSDRLSENWPTCQIIDSRNCVEVYCQDSDFDHHVNFLRLLYVIRDGLVDDVCGGVKNGLGILRVAVELGCRQMITCCVSYIEAVPWEESEEEEILRIIPGMGSQVEPILARLQPVRPSAILQIFLATLRFATSSPPPAMNDLKTSAQEQLEYMITEDDDAPLLTADDEIKLEVKECIKSLFVRFNILLESDDSEATDKVQSFFFYLSDFLWACQMLTKLEIMREFVCSWVEASDKIVQVVGQVSQSTEINIKVIEVATKVLEAIGYGVVILPAIKRLHMVKTWLPFVRITKPPLLVSAEEEVDGEMWQALESTFVSIILTLPSTDQAGILAEWLGDEQVRYPDLTEAFEMAFGDTVAIALMEAKNLTKEEYAANDPAGRDPAGHKTQHESFISNIEDIGAFFGVQLGYFEKQQVSESAHFVLIFGIFSPSTLQSGEATRALRWSGWVQEYLYELVGGVNMLLPRTRISYFKSMKHGM